MSQASKVLKEAGQLKATNGVVDNCKVVLANSAVTLQSDDSGKTFVFNSTTGFTMTLPSLANAGSGWNGKFVVGIANTSGDHVVTENAASDTNTLHGGISEANVSAGGSAAATAGTGATQVNFLVNTTDVGNYVDLVAVDGKWVIVGSMAQVDAAITIT